jgi:hypothetical protein
VAEAQSASGEDDEPRPGERRGPGRHQCKKRGQQPDDRSERKEQAQVIASDDLHAADLEDVSRRDARSQQGCDGEPGDPDPGRDQPFAVNQQ